MKKSRRLCAFLLIILIILYYMHFSGDLNFLYKLFVLPKYWISSDADKDGKVCEQ